MNDVEEGGSSVGSTRAGVSVVDWQALRKNSNMSRSGVNRNIFR